MNQPKNLAASVRARLSFKAKQEKTNFQDVFRQYAIERLLYRISCSQYRARFILKGAMVFQTWSENSLRRTTRDLDLMSFGENSVNYLEEVFREICQTKVEPDGLDFIADTVRGNLINETQKYMGVRIKLRTFFSNTRTRDDLQIDVGYGNVITPSAKNAKYPGLLDFPTPQLLVYPPETVVAEKFQAIVNLQLDNTRLKDYYDIATISQRFSFSADFLGKAIAATFKQRNTLVPIDTPIGLTKQFAKDPEKQRLLARFYTEAGIESQAQSLENLVTILGLFLIPLSQALANCDPLTKTWLPSELSWKNQEDR